MLRPTPPAVHEAAPGLLVPMTGGAAVRSLVSSTAPPTTTTRAACRRRRVFARVGHRSRLEERGALAAGGLPGDPHPQAAREPGTGTPLGVPVPGGAVRMPVTRA